MKNENQSQNYFQFFTDEQIQNLADFFYSSDTSVDVPFRIALTFGMGGIDLTKADLIKLLTFLRDNEPSKEAYKKLLEELDNEF